jgi:hypothetical protein
MPSGRARQLDDQGTVAGADVCHHRSRTHVKCRGQAVGFARPAEWHDMKHEIAAHGCRRENGGAPKRQPRTDERDSLKIHDRSPLNG